MFIFGGNTGMTPEQARRQQNIAHKLATRGGTARNVGEGISQIGDAILAVVMDRRAKRAEEEGRAAATKEWEALWGGGEGAGLAPPVNPAPVAPEAAAAESVQPHGDLTARMIDAESAGDPGAVSPKGAVGLMQIMPRTAMDPGYGVPNIFEMARAGGQDVPSEDIVTAMSLLRNPDLNVQFGEAYRDAMIAQQGGDVRKGLAAYNAGPGAVEAAGGVPAFAETQAYVDKLAPAGGAPAAPGGIPMRDLAPSPVGGVPAQAAPQAPMGGQMPTVQQLAKVLGNPYLNEGQRAVAQALLSQQLSPQKDRTPTSVREFQFAQQNGFQGGYNDFLAAKKGGVNVNVNTGAKSPEWGAPPKDHVWLKGPDGRVITEPDPSGRGVRPVSTPVAGSVDEQARMSGFEQTVNTANTMLDVIDGILSDDQLPNATGWGSYVPFDIPNVNARVRGRIAQFEGNLFLQAFESLKGGGQITEVEGRKATQAMARANTPSTYKEYKSALEEFKAVVESARDRANGKLPEARRWKPAEPEMARPSDIPQEDWDAATDEEKRMLMEAE